MQTAAVTQAQISIPQATAIERAASFPADTEFEVGRTFALLVATLVLPMHLALLMVSFSVGALI